MAEYKNKLVKQILSELGIVHNMICPYHAGANSADRVNRTMKPMIANFTENNHKAWGQHSYEFQYAINRVSNESTKHSHAFLNLSKSPRLILELEKNIRNSSHSRITYPRIKDIYTEKTPNFIKQSDTKFGLYEQNTKYFIRNHRDVPLNAGNQVGLCNHVIRSAAKSLRLNSPKNSFDRIK